MIYRKFVLISLAALSMMACQRSSEPIGMEQELNALYQQLPFEMPAYQLPSIPSTTVSLSDFGGCNDGVFDNTKAFADAIAHLSDKGGGRLVVDDGIWLTGPIEFKSRICLELKKGCVLLFSRNMDQYPLIRSTFEGLDAYRCQSPISGLNLEDIAIVGEGVIDGQGDAWRPVKKNKMTAGQWNRLLKSGGALNAKGDIWFPSQGGKDGYENAHLRNASDQETLLSVKDFFRPVLLSFRHCKNVLLQGVSFQNSPSWCLHPYACENVVLYQVSVRNPWYSQNGDGIDLESCSKAIIYKCTFDVGDDAICIKSGKNEEGRRRNMPTQDVLVIGNTVYHGHGGFVIGSEMSGGARRIYVKDCTFLGTDVGLRFKSTRGRGGVVENIFIENIQMIDIATEPLSFNLYYEGNSPVLEEGESASEIKPKAFPVDETTPIFRKIYINNVTCNGADCAMLFNGLPEMKISEVSVSNTLIRSRLGARLHQVDGMLLDNVTILPQSGEKISCKEVYNLDIKPKQ